MYHVYRGDYVYNAIKSGNWYPLYDPAWYNGVEILRYWSPFPAYVMAFCQYLAGGSQFGAYLFYIGGVCFLGACVWPFIGRGFNRPYLGAFIGLLWFFMPNNLCAIFIEGIVSSWICWNGGYSCDYIWNCLYDTEGQKEGST